MQEIRNIRAVLTQGEGIVLGMAATLLLLADALALAGLWPLWQLILGVGFMSMGGFFWSTEVPLPQYPFDRRWNICARIFGAIGLFSGLIISVTPIISVMLART